MNLRQTKSACSLLVFLLQIAMQSAASGFTSHISVNTPARSFTHGVGNLVDQDALRRSHSARNYHGNRNLRRPISQLNHGGYPRTKPMIPFPDEDIRQQKAVHISGWIQNSYRETSIPVLPASPYRVDSPDPESLWPEGLFLPPALRRSLDTNILDPYLLEGSEAIAAVYRASSHGKYYFHDIPHIKSLLSNQDLRVQNHLKPHRIASIRHTWPYNRI